MFESYFVNLGEQLTIVLMNILNFLPTLLLALVTVIIGLIFAVILGRAVAHVFDILKIDHFFNSLGVIHLSKKVGHDLTLGKIFGGLVKWTIIVSFLLVGFNILQLDYVSIFLVEILRYLPNVFIAGIILIITSILAGFTEKVIDGSVRSVGLKTGIAGTVAKYAIIFTGILAALSQLNILEVFANTLFIGIVAAVSLALGLAFGLGGKDAAARAIEKIEDDFTKK